MEELKPVLMGILLGSAARFLLLRRDYRQYPSNPQGYCVHMVLGVIAAALGAVAPPALRNHDWVAVTFLIAGAQHFREVRNIERQSLITMDEGESIKRGGAYIEDIAKKFESRNYIALIVALITSTITLLLGILFGCVAGIAAIIFAKIWMKPKKVSSFAEAKLTNYSFQESILMVDHVPLKNIGLEKSRQHYKEYFQCCVLIPREKKARMTLGNPGQRRTILYDVSTQLALVFAEDDQDYLPISKFDAASGNIILGFIMPKGMENQLLNAVLNCNILESEVKKPKYTKKQ
ncbi:MAG: YIEGIA domain-containing protein [Christensenellales bacterium]|jgi:hypothetical protein